MKQMKQEKLEYFTKEQILRMNVKTRRIYLLRIQLKNSLDTSQIAKKSFEKIRPNIFVYFVVSLLLYENIV